jgi:hypothetical protein
MSNYNSEIADKVLGIVEQNLKSQIEKGLKKYGKTLDDCGFGDHDFLNMALEECIDGMQYLVKKNKQLMNDLQLFNKLNQDLIEAEEENMWLKRMVAQSKEIIRDLKNKSRFSKYMQLEEENLRLAQEIEKLKAN